MNAPSYVSKSVKTQMNNRAPRLNSFPGAADAVIVSSATFLNYGLLLFLALYFVSFMISGFVIGEYKIF